MDENQRWRAGALAVILAAGVTAALAWLLPMTVARPPDGAVAPWLCALTETGSARFTPVVILLAICLWATDGGLEKSRRCKDAARMFVTMAMALPGLAALNESVVKTAVRAPRPSHLRLAAAGIVPDLDAFYALDKSSRRRALEARVDVGSGRTATALAIHPAVLEHWIRETGYTFPSGHAFSTFIAAVLATAMAVASPTRRRWRLAAGMLAWAIAVSLSRVLLLLHRPVDVVAGAAAGAACGALLALLWWKWERPGQGTCARAAAGFKERHGASG